MQLDNNKEKKIQQELGYNFKNINLLILALTHRSKGSPNNERLEFIGDSILNFVIAKKMFDKYPMASEGVLSRMRASLVKGDTLAKIAKIKNIGEYIILGAGEKSTGGHQRGSILADCVEALIGAIYKDSDDIKVVQNCILDWYEKEFDFVEESNITKDKDAKTKLQEMMQKKSLELPIYDIVKITGDAHEQEFTISCTISLLKESIIATGSTRKKAEQQAAQKILEILKK